MELSWLEQLKKPKGLRSTVSAKPIELFVQLYAGSQGLGVRVVNKQKQPVEVSHLDYSGYLRHLLQTMDHVQAQMDLSIDWENPLREILLHQHPYLIGLLRLCEAYLIDEQGNPLRFAEERGQITLHITPLDSEGKQLQARHQLNGTSNAPESFQVITEDAVLVDQTIYVIAPLGQGFGSLPLFHAALQQEDLTFFLSVYVSQLDHIALQYEDFRLQHSEEPFPSEPCLILEKVDTDQTLYLRVGQMMPGIGMERMNTYLLSRYAQINELEKTITIRPIEQSRQAELLARVKKLLGKSGGKKRGGAQNYILEDDLFIIDEEPAREFVTRHLFSLIKEFKVIENQQLKAYNLQIKPPKLRVKLDHGIDFLEGSVELAFDNESLNLFDVLRQYRKQQYITLPNGDKAILEAGYLQRLERIFKKKAKKDEVQVSFFDLPLVEELLETTHDRSPFQRSRKVFEGFAELDQRKVRLPKLQATLRGYQRYGFKWLSYLHEHQLGGCLADDMGLGKTLQAIAILAKAYQKKKVPPSLVVAPRSLLQNWQMECRKFAPQLSTHIYYGADRRWEEAIQAQVIITTYALMRNDIQTIKETQLHYAVLDESQNIKNYEAQTTRAAYLLQAEHRLALSGTPIENDLSELYSLFRFLNPGMFGSPAQFNADFGTPIQKHNDELATAGLRKKIFPFILRRKKQDVLNDLPDKVEQTIFVEMGDEQKKLYELRRRFYQALIEREVASQGIKKAQFVIFQALNELRQIATIPEQFAERHIVSAKRELLLEQLEETLANGRKALIFVNFLAAIEFISEDLERLGIGFVTMSGATRNRQELVDRFQRDPNCRVFLMTLKTGGTGLNLTAASTVFLYDPWWNIAAEKQAIDRTHRIGQQNKVHALRLIASGTIEEKIKLLQEKKQALFDNVIGADSAALKAMSEEDITFMLSQ
ncbi:MAG: DEAD/DEAH box helicase [Bacteroidota bacterium]